MIAALLLTSGICAASDDLRVIAGQIAEADLLSKLCPTVKANGNAIMIAYREHFADRDQAANVAWNEGRIDAQGTMIVRLTSVVRGAPTADVCAAAVSGSTNPFLRITTKPNGD